MLSLLAGWGLVCRRMVDGVGDTRGHVFDPRVGVETTRTQDIGSSQVKTETTEGPPKHSPTDDVLKLYRDGLTLDQAGRLTSSERKVLQHVRELVSYGEMPDELELKSLGQAIDKYNELLNGVTPPVKQADVERATKKYTVVSKNLGELLKTRGELEENLRNAQQELKDLKQPSSDHEKLKLGVRKADLEANIKLLEAQVSAVNVKLADKLNKRLDPEQRPGILQRMKELVVGKGPDVNARSLLDDLSRLDDPKVQARLLADKRTPSEILAQILDRDPSPETKLAIARHPQAGTEVLARLGREGNAGIKLEVAKHANTDSDTRKLLIQDDQAEISQAATKSLTTAAQRDARLLQNAGTSDATLGAILARNPGDLEVQKAVARHKQASLATLQSLAGDKQPEILKAIATNPNSTTLKALATDQDTPKELLQHLAKSKDAGVRLAVALNSHIDLRLLSSLARDADPQVRRALAENKDFQKRLDGARELVDAKITSSVSRRIEILLKEQDFLKKEGLLTSADEQLLDRLKKDPPSDEDVQQLEKFQQHREMAERFPPLTETQTNRKLELEKQAAKVNVLDPFDKTMSTEESWELKDLQDQEEMAKKFPPLGEDDAKLLANLEKKVPSPEDRQRLADLLDRALPELQRDATKPLEKLSEHVPLWLQQGANIDMSGISTEDREALIKDFIDSAKNELGDEATRDLSKRLVTNKLTSKVPTLVDQVKQNMKDNPNIAFALKMLPKDEAIKNIREGLKVSLGKMVTRPPEGMSKSFKLTQSVQEKLVNKFAQHAENSEKYKTFLDDLANQIYEAMDKEVPKEVELDAHDALKSVKIGDVKYQVKKFLGKGACGAVYLIQDPKTGKQLVAKLLSTQGTPAYEGFLREIDGHRYAVGRDDLQHPNIVGFVGVAKGPPPIHVMEYVPGKEMSKVLDDNRLSGEDRTLAHKLVMKQVISGMVHIQENRQMMHRDLKPDNIMINKKTLEAQIVDFGVGSPDTTSRNTTMFGTLSHMAPELVDVTQGTQEQYDNRVDTYSLGVMYFEGLQPEIYRQITHDPELEVLLDRGDRKGITLKIREEILKNLDKLEEKDRELVQAMLDLNPEQRPKLSDVLEHKAFALSEQEETQAKKALKRSTTVGTLTVIKRAASKFFRKVGLGK